MVDTALETIVCVTSSYHGYKGDGIDFCHESWLRVKELDAAQLVKSGSKEPPKPIDKVPVDFLPQDLAEKSFASLYAHNQWGYVSPSKVISFKPSGATEEITGVPELKIYYGVSSLPHLSGGFYTYEHNGETVFHSYLPENVEVDSKFVVEDWTGKYIPLTKEKVDAVLAEAAKDAQEGHWPYSIVEKAHIMGSNVGYAIDIDAKLKELGPAYERAEIVSFQKNVRENIESLFSTCMLGGGIIITPDNLSKGPQGEAFIYILKFLPHVIVPSDLKEGLLAVLGRYKDVAYDEAIKETRQTIKDENASLKNLIQCRKELDKTIYSLRFE